MARQDLLLWLSDTIWASVHYNIFTATLLCIIAISLLIVFSCKESNKINTDYCTVYIEFAIILLVAQLTRR